MIGYIRKKVPLRTKLLVAFPYNYTMRLVRWGIVLKEVRGLELIDELKLLASAGIGTISSFKDFETWVDPQSFWNCKVDVSQIGKFEVRGKCDDLWHVLPWREKRVLAEISARLQAGDVFVDAGANIGVYTVHGANLVGPHGRVVSVEMIPSTAMQLRRNVNRNELMNVQVVEKALGRIAKETIIARVPLGSFGQASVAKSMECGEEIEVQTTTLDEVTSDFSHINLLKMDLEGAESLAFEGGGETLKKTEAIIFEEWSGSRISQFLEERGFKVLRIDGANYLAVRRG